MNLVESIGVISRSQKINIYILRIFSLDSFFWFRSEISQTYWSFQTCSRQLSSIFENNRENELEIPAKSLTSFFRYKILRGINGWIPTGIFYKVCGKTKGFPFLVICFNNNQPIHQHRHTTYTWNNMCQKCEGNCGLWVLN